MFGLAAVEHLTDMTGAEQGKPGRPGARQHNRVLDIQPVMWNST